MAAVPTILPITVQKDAGSLLGTFVPSSSTLPLPSQMPFSHYCCSEGKTLLTATASLHCPTAQTDTSPHPGRAVHHSLSQHTAVLSLSPFHSHTQVSDCPQAPVCAALPDCSRAHPHPYLHPHPHLHFHPHSHINNRPTHTGELSPSTTSSVPAQPLPLPSPSLQ